MPAADAPQDFETVTFHGGPWDGKRERVEAPAAHWFRVVVQNAEGDRYRYIFYRRFTMRDGDGPMWHEYWLEGTHPPGAPDDA